MVAYAGRLGELELARLWRRRMWALEQARELGEGRCGGGVPLRCRGWLL